MNAAHVQNGTIRKKFAATTVAVMTAHEAPLREAMDRASWSRRGLLRRLSR